MKRPLPDGELQQNHLKHKKMVKKVNAFFMTGVIILFTLCLSATLMKWTMWSLEVWKEVFK